MSRKLEDFLFYWQISLAYGLLFDIVKHIVDCESLVLWYGDMLDVFGLDMELGARSKIS